METIETLQAGNTSEKDQRIVALTAQLATARAAEVSLDRRCNELVSELESRTQRMIQMESDANVVHQQARERESRLAAATGTLDMLEQEVSALKQETRQQADGTQRLARELDLARDGQRRAEAEAHGLRAALEVRAGETRR